MKDEDDVLTSPSRRFRAIAAILGVSGVGLGALGAHVWRQYLIDCKMLEAFHAANQYQLIHAVCLIGVAALYQNNQKINRKLEMSHFAWGGNLIALGTTLFSGSIYLLCFKIGPARFIGPLTPLGAFVIVGGWSMLGFKLWKGSDETS